MFLNHSLQKPKAHQWQHQLPQKGQIIEEGCCPIDAFSTSSTSLSSQSTQKRDEVDEILGKINIIEADEVIIQRLKVALRNEIEIQRKQIDELRQRIDSEIRRQQRSEDLKRHAGKRDLLILRTKLEEAVIRVRRCYRSASLCCFKHEHTYALVTEVRCERALRSSYF